MFHPKRPTRYHRQNEQANSFLAVNDHHAELFSSAGQSRRQTQAKESMLSERHRHQFISDAGHPSKRMAFVEENGLRRREDVPTNHFATQDINRSERSWRNDDGPAKSSRRKT
jgi:hypothetical protein